MRKHLAARVDNRVVSRLDQARPRLGKESTSTVDMKRLFFLVVLCTTVAQVKPTATAAERRAPSSRDSRGSHNEAVESDWALSEHAVFRRQSCDYSDVYDLIERPLECQEDFLAALRVEIDNSKCRNSYYRDPDDDWFDTSLCEKPLDTRHSIRNCSEPCSARQFRYMLCSHFSSKYSEIEAQCELAPYAAREYCVFDRGDFCFLKNNQTNRVIVECYATANVSTIEQDYFVECSSRCRQAVVAYKNNSGCCVDFWSDYSHRGGPSIYNLFSACNVDIPLPCTSFSPPSEFLDCTRSGVPAVSSASATVVFVCTALALIMDTVRGSF